MTDTLYFPSFDALGIKLQVTTRTALAGDTEQIAVVSTTRPTLTVKGNSLVAGAIVNDAKETIARAMVRRLTQGLLVTDGFLRVRLRAAGWPVKDGPALLTPEGLVIAVPASTLMPRPGVEPIAGTLPVMVRKRASQWEARLCDAWPAGWPDAIEPPLQPAVNQLVDALSAHAPSFGRCVTKVAREQRWTPILPSSSHWPWTLWFDQAELELEGQGDAAAAGMRLRPSRLRAVFTKGPAVNKPVVQYELIESHTDTSSASVVAVELDPPPLTIVMDLNPRPASGEAEPRIKLCPNANGYGESLPLELVPVVAGPAGPADLWTRVKQGWLHIGPRSGTQWGRPAIGSETREANLSDWLPEAHRRQLDLTLLLDNTTLTRLHVSFVAGQREVSSTLYCHDAAVRVLAGRHVVTGDAQRSTIYPPYFDESTAGTGATDVRFTDGGGRHLDRMMLLTPRLVEGPATQRFAVRLRYDTHWQGEPVWTIETDIDEAWKIVLWRQFSAVPLAAPLEWGANDPDSARRPSALRGLVPVRFSRFTPKQILRLHPHVGPFEFPIFPGDNCVARLWDPEREQPWRPFPDERTTRELWPILRDHLGVELHAPEVKLDAQEGDTVRVTAKVRYALPHLDPVHRAARPVGLDESAAAGSERVRDRYLKQIASIPLLSSKADDGAACFSMLKALAAARHQWAFQGAAAVAASGSTEAGFELTIEHQGTLLDLRLFVRWTGTDRSAIRRWALQGRDGRTPKLAGLPLTPVSLRLREDEGLTVRVSVMEPFGHPRTDLVLRLGLGNAGSGRAELEGISGRLAFTGGATWSLLANKEDKPTSARYDRSPLSALESTNLEIRAGGDLHAGKLVVQARIGAASLAVPTTAALTIRAQNGSPTASATLEQHPGNTPLLRWDKGELALEIAHRLPALELRETLTGDADPCHSHRLTVRAAGSATELSGVQTVAAADRLFLTWAGKGDESGSAYPADPTPDALRTWGIHTWGVLPRALLRLHIVLRRDPEGPTYRLEGGLIGWSVGALWSMAAGVGERHATLVVPVAGRVYLELNGLWRHQRSVVWSGRKRLHSVEIACWDARLALARSGSGDFERTGDMFEVVARHTLVLPEKGPTGEDASISWCALQTARIIEGSLDLSAVFALVPLKAGEERTEAVVLRRPGVKVQLSADLEQPNRGARLLILPCVVDGPELKGTLLDGDIQPPSPGPGVAVSRPWLVPEVVGEEPIGGGSRWRAASPTNTAEVVLQRPGNLAGSTAAGFTLYLRESDTAWVPSRIASIDFDAMPPPVGACRVWALGESTFYALAEFAASDVDPSPTTKPDDLHRTDARVRRTKQILAGARWHHVAVLEHVLPVSSAGEIRWTLVDSPLLDRDADLALRAPFALAPNLVEAGDLGLGVAPLPAGAVLRDRFDDTSRRASLTIEKIEQGIEDRTQGWCPPHLQITVACDDGAGVKRPAAVVLSVERAVPFEADGSGDPFATSVRPFWPTLPDPLVASGIPFLPLRVRLAPRSPRPGENTGHALALATRLAGETASSPAIVVPALDRAFVLRTPLALDDQEVINVEIRPCPEVQDRNDGMRTVLIGAVRNHPERLSFGDPAKPVALALNTPGVASAAIGDRALFAVWIHVANLLTQFPEAKRKDAVLRLTLSRPSDTELPKGVVRLGRFWTDTESTATEFGDKLSIPIYDFRAPPSAEHGIARSETNIVFEAPEAAATWDVALLRAVSGVEKETDESSCLANISRSFVVGRQSLLSPSLLCVMEKTNVGGRIAAYGPDLQKWESFLETGELRWKKAASILDRVPKTSKLQPYVVLAIAPDGGCSTGEATEKS